MADFSVRNFLQANSLDPAAGISPLVPTAAEGSVRYLCTSTSNLQANQQLISTSMSFKDILDPLETTVAVAPLLSMTSSVFSTGPQIIGRRSNLS
jgi:hypothetical protein